MDTKSNQLHICFFPFPAHGHMLPTVDMAKLFASRGCKSTVVLTHANAPFFADTIERSRSLGLDIDILLIKFPAAEVGLPEGCENPQRITTSDMADKFFAATAMLEQPLGGLLSEHRPDCLVAAAFFPWATGVAASLGIPRLVFHGTGFFASCVTATLMKYKPHEEASLGPADPFLVPYLPGEITFVKDQLPPSANGESEWRSFARKVIESEVESHGVVVNSFYELEPEYADHYRRFLGRKAWHVGPISLLNKEMRRGPESSVDERECLDWLGTKQPRSVVYVSFGTIANFVDAQMREIAAGLEASGKDFIWVVKKEKKKEEGGVIGSEEWLPEGFEERMKGKGVVIRGWAPQAAILRHGAIGGFVTHCGWNSVLEGVSAGLPMVTWPVAAEQFYNEKLVTELLGIGVGVGARKWARFEGDSVRSDAVEKAVRRIMDGEEAAAMRSKAEALAELAKSALEEEGGSSRSDLASLIQELRQLKTA